MDIFTEVPTLLFVVMLYDPDHTKNLISRDPRGVASVLKQYLKETGIADVCNFGQEVEFFIFDDVRWDIQMNGCFYKVDSEEAAWNTGKSWKMAIWAIVLVSKAVIFLCHQLIHPMICVVRCVKH